MNRLKWTASTAGVLAVTAGVIGVAMAETGPASTTLAASANSPATRHDSASAPPSLLPASLATSASASASTNPDATTHSAATSASISASTSAPFSAAVTQASSSAISLTTWAGLLLPINNEGQPTGKDAKVISPAKLTSPWLTQTSSGALQFWAPSGAATTPGSTHSRTELESAIKYDVGTQKHVLTATLEILQLPKSNPEICIAQLHAGGSSGSDPFVMFDFKSGKLYVMVASGTSVEPTFYTLLTSVPLNTPLTYRLADNGNGTLSIGANSGSQSKSYTVSIPSVLKGASGHFSAGDYQQGTVSEGSSDGGKVLFTALTQS